MSAQRLASVLALGAAVVVWPMCGSSSAVVGFAPFELASAYQALGIQAEYAYEPAISPDGRFVAFTGLVGSKSGVFRKDLTTGQLAVVALGAGAGAPSISSEGRYVSFTSPDDPVTGAPSGEGCTQVYRRDMDIAGAGANPLEPGPPGAYAIASGRSGSEEPLKYEGSGSPGCPGSGSASANHVAISADGSEVVFTAIGNSDLTGDAEATEAPPDQVAVRDFSTMQTSLVSVVHESEEPVEGGAALSGSPALEHAQRSHGGTFELSRDNASTAAISSDGTTVAWMGLHIAQQVPVGGTADPLLSAPIPAYQYAEPLWRRIAGAQAGPTRRVLAGDEPECPPSCPGGLDLRWDEQQEQAGEEPVGPQYGSYVTGWLHGVGDDMGVVTPQLSADGEQVAILSTQPDSGHLPEFGTAASDREKTPQANAFVVDMAPGLTREQAITRLTEWGSIDFSDTALDGAINQIAISGDGTRVVFATERNVFALAPPALVSAPVSQLEPAQLYEANLQAGTLALVSEGYDGEPADTGEGHGGVGAAALSQDGGVLALASGSSNLAYGTFNEGSDVFVTREQDSPALPGQQSVSPLPPGPAPETSWGISATAHSSSHGALLIDVSVPGPGRLAASASAPVPIVVKSAKPARSKARRARARRTVIATRRVAHATAAPRNEGVVAMRLLPSSAYSSLASRKGGLYAAITITFAAPGHRTITKTLHASFPRPPAVHPKKPARKSSRATRGHA